MTHVFQRQIRDKLPEAVGGDGAYIITRDGRRFLDASGGAAVSCLGHSDKAVIAAIQQQAAALPFAHTGFFTTSAAEELATRLTSAAPGDLGHVWYVSGGSEATETALKLARQYFIERGETERSHFIARHQSYHGNTLGALAVGGNKARRAPYQPILRDWSHVSPCYAYRGKTEGETDAAYVERLGDELAAEIERIGPEKVAAFLAEPVVGASLGAAPAVEGYFRKIREVTEKYGVLMILDEVMCGMGRTGSMYACEQDGIAPDLLTCAKGLGAGYQPIGAVLVSERIFQTISDGSGAFQHGHTYMGHPVAAACALAVQKRLTDDGLLAGVSAKGHAMEQRLIDRLGNHPHVGEIRGRGLFHGIEIVRDQATKQPFDPRLKLHARIRQQGLERDMICYPGGGCVDGLSGDHVLLAPPFILSETEMDMIAERIGDSIDAAIASVG